MKDKYPKVYVTWKDACSHDQWTDVEDVDDTVPVIESVGWLLDQSDKRIVMALNYDEHNQQVSCVMVIPKVFVERIVIVDLTGSSATQ